MYDLKLISISLLSLNYLLQSNRYLMKNYGNIKLIFVVLFCLSGVGCQNSTCDYELILVSSAMGNFNTAAYNPPILGSLFNRLNSLRATILATYQLCFNKPIIDPDSWYPQDKSQCLMGLYNTSLLQSQYINQSNKIKSDIDKIAKIVFSTQNNCRPILNYAGWDNVTDDCKNEIKNFDDLINEYDSSIIIGGDGTRYLNNMLLQVQKLRKLCGFDMLIKPKYWNNDTCKSANLNWLYPITDQLDTIISKSNYKNFTAYFYNVYQSVYRAQHLCVATQQEMAKQ